MSRLRSPQSPVFPSAEDEAATEAALVERIQEAMLAGRADADIARLGSSQLIARASRDLRLKQEADAADWAAFARLGVKQKKPSPEKAPGTVEKLKAALKAAGVSTAGLRLKSDYQRAYDDHSRRQLQTTLTVSGAPPQTTPELKQALAAAGVDYSGFTRKTQYRRAYDEWTRAPPSVAPSRPGTVPGPASSVTPTDSASPVAGNGAPELATDEKKRRWRDLVRGLVVHNPDTDRRDGGPYRLTRFIASGTFGQVWAAVPESVMPETPEQEALRDGRRRPSERAVRAAYAAIEEKHSAQRVAIKLIWLDPTAEGGLDAETLSEVALQTHLAHPNILSAKAAFAYRPRSSPTGGATQQYLAVVMPLERESVAQTLRRWNADRKSVPRTEEVERRMRLISDIGAGLAYLAANGFVHADMKPDNVLMGWDGVARIADLGLARLVAGAKLGRSPTELVTTWWRSPELWAGWKDYTSAVDLWAFFCIAYEIAFREFPFERDPVTGSAMVDIGRRLGFPDSFVRMLTREGGDLDETAFRDAWPVIAAAPKLAVPWTRDTLDRAFLVTATDDERGYWRGWYGGATYTELWHYLYDLAQVDPRLRRNNPASGDFFADYPPRVPTPSVSDVKDAHLSRTDAYPPAEFPGVRPRTREYAQFLWNRLVAERSVPARKRREWWRAAFVLARKLMDDNLAALVGPPGQGSQLAKQPYERSGPTGSGTGKGEAGLEEALLVALGDPWRGFLVDPASERRKGRSPPFVLDEPYAPEPAADDLGSGGGGGDGDAVETDRKPRRASARSPQGVSSSSRRSPPVSSRPRPSPVAVAELRSPRPNWVQHRAWV